MKQAINDKNKYPNEMFILAELAALLKISDIFKYIFPAGI